MLAPFFVPKVEMKKPQVNPANFADIKIDTDKSKKFFSSSQQMPKISFKYIPKSERSNVVSPPKQEELKEFFDQILKNIS